MKQGFLVFVFLVAGCAVIHADSDCDINLGFLVYSHEIFEKR